tara:strand:+ start:391 stop:639 length:249 start_codon:yes stop_codon:yes gene_type:complete
MVKVERSSKVELSVIACSIAMIAIMVSFGSIDFFEGMSCEELKPYMSEVLRGHYPLETPFTPSQINNLDEQYEYQCTISDNL